MYMKNTACESLSPAILAQINQYFVPWYCNIDFSTESDGYKNGLGSYTLPMICCIDPNDPDDTHYLDRTTNVQDLNVFYNRLVSIANAHSFWWTGAVDGGGGWKYSSWFSYFKNYGSGWHYHAEHGWLYAVGSLPSSVWFWNSGRGWLWTSNTSYPFFWNSSASAWWYYYTGTGNGSGGWFRNYANGQNEWH